MKREAPYIVEWVAWHKLQGFDLFIADNCSEGPQTELLGKLCNAGLIRYLDFRCDDATPQLPAYRSMIRSAIVEGYRYLGFLDADEFFEPLTETGLAGGALVASQLEQKRVKAVSYRWCIFGSNGHERASDGMVLERFTRRARSEYPFNQWVKSFVRLSSISVRAFWAPNRLIRDPHFFEISRRHYCLDGNRHARMELDARPVQWRFARVRHFAVKSKEEYARKRGRGSAIFVPGTEPEYSKYWNDYDLNEIDDRLNAELMDKLHAAVEAAYEMIR